MSHRPLWVGAILGAGLIVLWGALGGSSLGGPAPETFGGAGTPGSSGPGLSLPKQAALSFSGQSLKSGPAFTPRESSLAEWLGGGFLAPLGYRLARGYPLEDLWPQGLWPPGLLDLLALTLLGFLALRLSRRLKRPPPPEENLSRPRFWSASREGPVAVTVREEARPGLAALPDFDLQAFVAEAQSLVREVYEAWNRQQLDSLNGRVRENLLEYLKMGLKILSLREEVSYLEDLTLERLTITAAGTRDGAGRITVLLQGRLLDYVLDRKSGRLLLGSMAYPTPFQEYWELERPRGHTGWVLLDIREF